MIRRTLPIALAVTIAITLVITALAAPNADPATVTVGKPALLDRISGTCRAWGHYRTVSDASHAACLSWRGCQSNGNYGAAPVEA